MNRIGTNYGGWNLPVDINLTNESIIYSCGVGEDVSFDLLLQDRYKSKIILIDPTLRSLKHWNEIQMFYKTGVASFSGDIQRDYVRTIQNSKPDFDKFTYINKGVWSSCDTLKFFKPVNEKYVSHTLIQNMYSDNYVIVEVDSIKNIMTQLGHTKIDLLKLDIEGSEIVVINKMLDDAILPNYVCVEFDLKIKDVDHNKETETLINRFIDMGYTLADNNSWNCLFIKLPIDH